MVGLLLSRAADLLPSQDKHGKTGLHIAAMNGHYAMVEVLLGQGAEIDANDRVCDFLPLQTNEMTSEFISTEWVDSTALLGARWLLRRGAASHRQRCVAESGNQLRKRPHLVCSVRGPLRRPPLFDAQGTRYVQSDGGQTGKDEYQKFIK